jgi:transcription elongation factor Elf1
MNSKQVAVKDHTCPACGMPAPALLATLPSGRRVLVEACAICGLQQTTPVNGMPPAPMAYRSLPAGGLA